LCILLLNENFHPDLASTAPHSAQLALALARQGHDVTVLTGRGVYSAPRRFASRFVQPSLDRRAAQFPQRIGGNPTRGWRTQFMNLPGNLDRRPV
jgi:hypothetical protein